MSPTAKSSHAPAQAPSVYCTGAVVNGMPRSPQCQTVPSCFKATVPTLLPWATLFHVVSLPIWTGTPRGTRSPWPRPPNALPPQVQSVPSLLIA